MMHGELRLYDSTDDPRSVASSSVYTYVHIGTSYTDKTTEASVDDTGYTGTFCAAASDAIFVGNSSPFCRINFVKGGGAYAVGSGALVPYYWNGAWTALPSFTDGTMASADCFTQDGVISFQAPSDWVVGGGGSLSSTKYYIKLMTTSIPSPAPSADVLWPVDGQYFKVVFSAGDLTAPEGRARPEETPVFDRGRGSADAHYIMGPDTPIVEPLEVSFSVKLDTVINKTALMEAVQCGNPNYNTLWDATGTSTKTDTKYYNGNGVLTSFPAFEDTMKKSIAIQIIWTRGGVAIGRAYNEVYFAPDQVSLAEAEDGVTLSFTGLIYGSIDVIHHFGYAY
jgi:hypothetical protein